MDNKQIVEKLYDVISKLEVQARDTRAKYPGALQAQDQQSLVIAELKQIYSAVRMKLGY